MFSLKRKANSCVAAQHTVGKGLGVTVKSGDLEKGVSVRTDVPPPPRSLGPPHLESKAVGMEAACSAALVSARGTRRGGDTLLLQRGVTITRLVWALC